MGQCSLAVPWETTATGLGLCWPGAPGVTGPLGAGPQLPASVTGFPPAPHPAQSLLLSQERGGRGLLGGSEVSRVMLVFAQRRLCSVNSLSSAALVVASAVLTAVRRANKTG